MIRFIGRVPKTHLQFTNFVFRPGNSQTGINRTLSVLHLLENIMGKVRNVTGRNKLKQSALVCPSTSPIKVKKSVEENLMAKQNVKFKAKSVGAADVRSSEREIPKKAKKKLQKDLVFRALTEKSHKEKHSESVEKQINILPAEAVLKTKMDSVLRRRAKKRRKGKQVREEDKQRSFEADNIHPEKSLKHANDVPLAVEMPKVIDASDTTLSVLNATSDIDVTQNMDTSDTLSETDGKSVPCLVSDLDSTRYKKSKITDIPLAVVMPCSISSVLSTEKARKDKVSLKKDKKKHKLTPEGKRSADLNSSSLDAQAKELNKSLQNAVCKTDNLNIELPKKDQNLVVLENVKVHLVGSSIALQLIHPVKFFIFGQVMVQVLSGKIIILGYEIDNKSSSHLVSSLRGSSFLSIRTSRPKCPSNAEIDFPAGLQDEDALKSLIGAVNSNDVWVLLKEGNEEFLEYIQMYLEYPICVKELRNDEFSSLSQAQEALKCVFQPEPGLGKRIHEAALWKSFTGKIINERNSCTVLCGGNGVGKSTLLRYLVNQILSSGVNGARGVVLLDFDPGQAELTPPGCVAVSLITKPLLGPNFTHLQPSERCVYIGEISVTQCLGRYMEASASIINFFRESPHLASLPCIVNTMGFTQGIGVTIMGQLIRLLRPTRVIQIESRRQRDNYPFHLTSTTVISHSKSSDARCIRESLEFLSPEPEREDLSYELVILQSAAEVKSSKDENVWGMKPRVKRDAVILSYFSSMVQPPLYSILDDIPYSCPLGTLFLCVAHEQVPPNLVLAALNGNLVGLCTIDPMTPDVLCHQDPHMPRVLVKVPIAPCLGFGIVRGVDMQDKMLYLTTPLQEDKLLSVNCLIFGAVNLPTSVYIKSSAPGLVPYVSSGHHPNVLSQ